MNIIKYIFYSSINVNLFDVINCKKINKNKILFKLIYKNSFSSRFVAHIQAQWTKYQLKHLLQSIRWLRNWEYDFIDKIRKVHLFCVSPTRLFNTETYDKCLSEVWGESDMKRNRFESIVSNRILENIIHVLRVKYATMRTHEALRAMRFNDVIQCVQSQRYRYFFLMKNPSII